MKKPKTASLGVLIAVLSFTSETALCAATTGTLELSIVDSSTGRVVPARVLLRDHLGKDHVPAGLKAIPVAQDKWFVALGPGKRELPAGVVSIRVERGLEYEPIKDTVTIEAGRTLKH